MARISLKEAYDNRDVIAWLAAHQDAIDELQEILNNLPDPDLTNVVLKTGDQTIEGTKTFTDPIISQGGVTLASGGLHIGGDLQVDGDIIQDGSEYETHAEQVFSKNDLIVTRDGAIGAIVSGGISGVRVNKYDGVNSLNLGVDSTGVMRVGDVGDEQPLMTRDEVADMTSGNIVVWDGVNKKAITSAKSVSDLGTDIAAKVSGTGNIGDDNKPVKIVNGEAVPVTGDLVQGVNVTKILTGVCSPGVNNVTFSEEFDYIPQVYLSVFNSNPGLIWTMAITAISKTGFSFETKYSGLTGNVPSGYTAFYQDVMWMAIGN